MSLISAILGGLLLGLFMAISVGPTLFAIIKYSLNHSYKTGLAFVMGVSISDIMYVSIANLAAPWLDFIYKYDVPFRELFFDVEEGVRINGLHFHVEQPLGLVLYFHGNSRSIKGWAKYAKDFYRYKYDVVLVDYRGFGKSTGKITEKKIYEQKSCYHRSDQRFRSCHCGSPCY